MLPEHQLTFWVQPSLLVSQTLIFQTFNIKVFLWNLLPGHLLVGLIIRACVLCGSIQPQRWVRGQMGRHEQRKSSGREEKRTYRLYSIHPSACRIWQTAQHRYNHSERRPTSVTHIQTIISRSVCGPTCTRTFERESSNNLDQEQPLCRRPTVTR